MTDLWKVLQENRLPRPEDFSGMKLIAKGGFGNIYKCIDNATGEERAIKEISKDFLISRSFENSAMRERQVLSRLDSVWILKLYGSWQDELTLYFVLDYMPNGDLGDLIVTKCGYLPLELVRHYTGELALAIQYLQDMNVVNKDIKPPNILLDKWWHTKICDFGICQTLANRQAYSRGALPQGDVLEARGSRAYIAPELLREEPLSYGPDRWAYGCVVYEMHTGNQAFPEAEPELEPWHRDYHQRRILEGRYMSFPRDQCHPDLVDFCNQIFQQDPKYRLGANGIEELKAHPFVSCLDWDNLHEIHPPVPFFSRPRKVLPERFIKRSEAPPSRNVPDLDRYSVPSGSPGSEFLVPEFRGTPPLPGVPGQAAAYLEPAPQPGCCQSLTQVLSAAENPGGAGHLTVGRHL